jgi:hypothetical protein
MAVPGPDYRLAVLPSLAAWVATAVLGFLIARRAVRRGGNLAGAAAALFILASPAYKAFATDIMLESLGACLTLLALYCYLRTIQTGSVLAARSLGLALTLLFLLKYNYWLMALIPLATAEVISQRSAIWRGLRQLPRAVAWLPWLRAQWRHPLNYVLAIVVSAAILVACWPEDSLTIAGWTIAIHSADNVVHLAYVVLFVRALPWWWRRGREWARGLNYPYPQLLAWHALPAALWFLWPKRPSYFLWYLTRNHGGEVTQHDLPAAAAYYWNCLTLDYHESLAGLLLVVGLVAVAALSWRQLRPGGVVVLVFLGLATLLAVRYPSHRSRFLHSWLASGWVVAGMGLALLLYGWLGRFLGKARPWLAATALAGLLLIQLPGLLDAGHAPEGGLHPLRPSVLDVTDDYLPDLAHAQAPVILSNAPIRQMHWTYLERYGRQRHTQLQVDLPRMPGAADFGPAFGRWLQHNSCEVMVFISAPPGTTLFEEPGRPGFDQIPALMASQSTFTLVSRREFPEFGCAVMTWCRANPAARALTD